MSQQDGKELLQAIKNVELSASAAEVWALIGDFNAVPQWHPGIESSTLENGGQVRRVQIAGGGENIERLTAYDAEGMAYSYMMVEGPIPVSDYTAILSVEEGADGRSHLIWSAEFLAAGVSSEEAEKAISDFFQAGVDNLQKIFG